MKTKPTFIPHTEILFPITGKNYCFGNEPVSIETWQAVYSWAVKQGYVFDHPGTAFAAGHPVQTINWFDAVKWCNARSEMTGAKPVYFVAGQVMRAGNINPTVAAADGYRLPTAAEWEFAARGGLLGKLFPNGDKIHHPEACYTSPLLPYAYDGGPFYIFPKSTAPCASLLPNGYGIKHAVGNAWQFTGDSGQVRNSVQIVGGCWKSLAGDLRFPPARKLAFVDKTSNGNDMGFRCARNLP